jgi:pyruvate-ferredoxin/flavodoxin oxidoreductase
MRTLKAFLEAEAYDGPSPVIAYSHCIAHGYDMVRGLERQKNAVNSGHWPLFRFNPELIKTGKNPFRLDSKPPTLPLDRYIYNETRYSMLRHSNPKAAQRLLVEGQAEVMARWKLYELRAAQNGASDPKPVVENEPAMETLYS